MANSSNGGFRGKRVVSGDSLAIQGTLAYLLAFAPRLDCHVEFREGLLHVVGKTTTGSRCEAILPGQVFRIDMVSKSYSRENTLSSPLS